MEEVTEELGAFVGHDAADDFGPVIGSLERELQDRGNGAGLEVERAENQAPDAGLDEGAKAHRTRLDGHVEVAIRQAVVPGLSGRLTKSDDLGVSRGVGTLNGLVMAPGDDTAVPDDDGADGNLAPGGGLAGLLERCFHEYDIVHGNGILLRKVCLPQSPFLAAERRDHDSPSHGFPFRSIIGEIFEQEETNGG